jgi:apolipoprotein N-acyltransferase
MATALLVGLLSSVALPAGEYWLQGNGLVMLFALAPLFFAIERFFESQPWKQATAYSLLCSYLCAWAIEIGFFHWGVSGIQTFLGLNFYSASVMAAAVLAVHALAALPAFAIYIAVRGVFGAQPVAQLGALLMMPMFEHLAPRMFYFTYGSFLSLSSLSSPLISWGGTALPSLLVFLGGWALGAGLGRMWTHDLLKRHVNSKSRLLPRWKCSFVGAAFALGILSLSHWTRSEEMPWTQKDEVPKEGGTQRAEVVGNRPPLKLLLVQPARRFSKEVHAAPLTDAYERYSLEEKEELKLFRDMVLKVESTLARLPVRPDLVVFPESLFSPIYKTSDSLRNELAVFLSQLEIPSLLHYSVVAPSSPVMGLTAANSESTRTVPYVSLAEIREKSTIHYGFPYQKRQLMPYGEYLPWRPLWEILLPTKTLERLPKADAIPQLGHSEPLVLNRGSTDSNAPSDDVVLGVTICFDGISPEFAREAALGGADVLINLSNLEWMASAASERVFGAIVRLRALETGRPVVFLNNSGGTAVYDGTGKALLSPLPHDDFRVAFVEVPLDASSKNTSVQERDEKTLFLERGHEVVAGAGLVGVVMITFLSTRTRLRRKGKS